MKLILISGNGAGAGKTWAAEMFADETYSLASQIRSDLHRIYPAYDWFNKTQDYKTQTLVPEWQNKTIRQVLFEYGQQKCQEDPLIWARKLVEGLRKVEHIADGKKRFAVDDTRKLCELDYLKSHFPGAFHIHVDTKVCIHEPAFEARELMERADYVVQWEKR